MKPAIVLATHTVGLNVIRGLGAMGVPVIAVHYDRRDMGHVSRYVTEAIPAPHPLKNEDQFVDLLIESAGRFGGGLLIPANDVTLAAVSRHKGLLSQHYTVACTEWDITEKLIDKKYTYTLADEIGVPAPKTLLPRSIDDVERFSQEAQYPCLVKPSLSHQYREVFQERKMARVSNADEMLSAYQQAMTAGLEVMLQEWIPGDDSHGVSYRSYFWNGKALVEFTGQQLRNAPPETGSPRLIVSAQIPEVIEPGRKILQALGYYGMSCTEFKKDPRDGVYKLMEVNGRHSHTELLDIRCGINFPWLEYKHLMDGELPSATDYRTGVYWIHLTTDVIHSLKHRKTERYTLKQYIQPYLSPHVFAILDLRDPRPFLQRGVDAVRRVVDFVRARILRSRGTVTEAETVSSGSLDRGVDPTS